MRENTSVWKVLCRDREGGWFEVWGICGGAGKVPTVMTKISQSEVGVGRRVRKGRREHMNILEGPVGRLDPNPMTYGSIVGP